MTKKCTVLSIDDDKFIHKIIERTLGSDYDTLFAQTGEEGFNLARMHKPDIIITDVEMPGLNGYEVCEKLKSHESTKHIPVIFLSSLDSLQEKLSGFESGADDYLVKPFDAEKLISKIEALSKYVEEQAELEQKIAVAEETAYLALTGTNEIGIAMKLIENSYSINTIQELANSLIEYTKSKDLNCTVLLLDVNSIVCVTSKGAASPLELDLIQLLRAEEDRFHDFGCRTQINFPNISLLINNMPIGNLKEYARIKDFYTPILAAYDTKIKTLNIERVFRNQSINLNNSFINIKETLDSIGGSLHKNAKSSFSLLSEMMNELNMTLPSMGLETDQEDYILNKIETAVESARNAAEAGDDTKASFTRMINQLQSLVDQQQLLLESSALIQKAKEINIDQGSKDSGSMDVELF